MNGNGSVRDYKQDYEIASRILDSQKKGIDAMTLERDKLKDELIIAMQVNASLEKQMFQLKDINRNAILGHNQKEHELANEIQRLREKIKSLGGNPD